MQETGNRNQTVRFLTGLLVILAVYSGFNIFFQGDLSGSPDRGAFTLSLPRHLRHLVRLVAIGMVYLTGYICLRNQTATWMLNLWQLTYATLFTALILIGGIDLFFRMVSQNLKEISITISEVLMSPLLYLGIGLFKRMRSV